MQIKTIQQQVGMNETVCEAAGEHIVECDVLMPDYYPDILKVVRIDAEHKLKDSRLSAGTLTVEGSTNFRILYIPQGEKGVKSFIHQVPFEKNMDVKGDEDADVRVTLKTQYLNCRILNSRKASLRAVISINVTVTSTAKMAMAQNIEGDRKDIELLSSDITVSEPVGSASKTFKVFEDMEISKSKPAALDILLTDATVYPTDMKLIANKAVVKGDANIKLVYSTVEDPAKLETMTYQIPFSQIIDLAGVDDGCSCFIDFDVTDTQARVIEDPSGEGRIVSLELIVKADAKAFQDREIAVITDAFSTAYASSLTTKSQKYEKIAEVVDAEAQIHENVQLSIPEIMGIVDVSGKAFVKQIAPAEEGIEVRGSLEISVLAFTQSGDLENIDRAVPFKFTRKAEADKVDVTVGVESLSFTLPSEDSMELRAQLRMRGLLMKSESINIINSIEVNEQQPKDIKSMPAMVVYYPEKGERIWDIAKHYNTSKAEVMNANKLEKETIDSEKLLLIPVKH